MKRENKIRVALIGCGRWGLNLLHELSLFNSIGIVGCVDRSPLSLEKIRKLYPRLSLFSKTSDLYDHTKPDAIIIATQNSTHFPLAMEGLIKGIHVWIEKPAVETEREFNQLITVSNNLDKVVFVDHIYQYDEGIQKLVSETKKIFLGKPYMIRSIRANYGTFRLNESVVRDLEVHDLTIASQIYGSKSTSVTATASSIGDRFKSDTAVIHITYPNNQHIFSLLSWQSPRKIRHIEVIGSSGMIEYDENGQERSINSYTIKHKTVRKINSTVLTVSHTSLYNAIDHFVNCIQGHKHPISDLKCALGIYHIITAIEESISGNGKTIFL